MSGFQKFSCPGAHNPAWNICVYNISDIFIFGKFMKISIKDRFFHIAVIGTMVMILRPYVRSIHNWSHRARQKYDRSARWTTNCWLRPRKWNYDNTRLTLRSHSISTFSALETCISIIGINSPGYWERSAVPNYDGLFLMNYVKRIYFTYLNRYSIRNLNLYELCFTSRFLGQGYCF